MKTFIKKVILRVGRPIWKRLGPRFYARIDKRIDLRLAQVDAGWKHYAPSFLNAVATVQSLGRELAHVTTELQELRARDTASQEELTRTRDELRALMALMDDIDQRVGDTASRIEFVRREILFEMKYGRGIVRERQASASGRVLNPERVALAAEEGVRLNLGCGHFPLDGYINVDMRELPGVDIVAEVGNLPIEKMSVREVFSAHLLEHFPQEELTRRLLPYWRDMLMNGGEFRAVAPDGEAMLAGVAIGAYSWEDFREVLFGAQDYDGDFHYNLFTPSSLSQLLEKAGFRDVRLLAQGRRNGRCFEFEVSAIK